MYLEIYFFQKLSQTLQLCNQMAIMNKNHGAQGAACFNGNRLKVDRLWRQTHFSQWKHWRMDLRVKAIILILNWWGFLKVIFNHRSQDHLSFQCNRVQAERHRVRRNRGVQLLFKCSVKQKIRNSSKPKQNSELHNLVYQSCWVI